MVYGKIVLVSVAQLVYQGIRILDANLLLKYPYTG